MWHLYLMWVEQLDNLPPYCILRFCNKFLSQVSSLQALKLKFFYTMIHPFVETLENRSTKTEYSNVRQPNNPLLRIIWSFFKTFLQLLMLIVSLMDYHFFISKCQIYLSVFEVDMPVTQDSLSSLKVWEETMRIALYILSDYKD